MDIDELKDKGYFNRRIFRAGVLVMLLFFLFLVFKGGLGVKAYVHCPEDSLGSCVNPWYYCEHVFYESPTGMHSCPSYKLGFGLIDLNKDCGEVCDVQSLRPGESLGERPLWYETYASGLLFIVLVLTFLFNHLWYKWRVEV